MRANAEDEGWDERRIAVLSQLWDEGLSTAAIGARLGVSKNAVIGRARRLGLPRRPSPIPVAGAEHPAPRPASRRDQAARRAPPVTLPGEPVSPRVDAPPPRVRLSPPPMIGSHRCCQWPFGDPGQPGFRFCGAATVPGRSYCLAHTRRAYVAVSFSAESVS